MRVIVIVLLLFSAAVAGCAPRSAAPPAGSPPASKDQVPVVTVVMREFEFEPRPLKVKAGMVRFQLMNRGSVEHDFAVPSLQGHNDHDQHLVKPGQTKIIEMELKPGTYEALCTIAGHKEVGMVLNIEVSP